VLAAGHRGQRRLARADEREDARVQALLEVCA